ncbi:MAG TPA: hypothetical protein G4O02_13275, partial [Caldilineae bacterium]|nr:hypothetical protein [Caldilineae bacterium]
MGVGERINKRAAALGAAAILTLAAIVGGAYLAVKQDVGVMEATPTPPANILFFRDDYANTEIRLSHPWWPPAGSMRPWNWNEIEPSDDSYSWGSPDKYISTAQEQRVELETGDVVTKPVMMQIEIYTSDYVDHTPSWVYQKMGRSAGYELDPGGGCPAVTMPMYDDPVWQAEYDEIVQELASRYKSYDNVVGYWISVGVDGEATPIKNREGCDYQAEAAKVLTCDEYKAFIKHAIDVAIAAWSPKPVWIQAAPAPCSYADGSNTDRKEIVQYASAAGAGYKMNGLAPDQQDAYGTGTWDQAMKYDVTEVVTTAVAFEFSH